jgi:Leucine-rich repeat (LRR) protein
MPRLVLIFLVLTQFSRGAWEDRRTVKDSRGEVVELDVSSTWISDADLAKVARLTGLRKLDLSQTKITDAGMEHLNSLPRVVELNCYFAEFLTDDAVRHLRGWKNLEHLNLHGTRIGSKSLAHLAQITSLRWLDVGFTDVDDEGFEALASLTRLEHLGIGGNHLNGSALKLLKLLPSLISLDVSGIQRVDSGLWSLPLTDENVRRIGELSGLKRLNLARANLPDLDIDHPFRLGEQRRELRDLSPLAKLVNLESLDLSGQNITPEALKALTRVPKLRDLRLGLVPTLDDSAEPVLSSLIQLKTLYISGSKMSAAALAKVVR